MKFPGQIANRDSSTETRPTGNHLARRAAALIVCGVAVALAAAAGWAATVQYRVLHLFTERESVGISAPLVLGPDGNFYGITSGGPTTAGDIFKITPSGTFTILHVFPLGGGQGGGPSYGGLLAGKDGNFYGIGSDNAVNGTEVFKMTPEGSFTQLHSFKPATDLAHGAYPTGSLVQNGDGLLYGTAVDGGPNGGGIFYSLTTNGDFTILHGFPATGSNGGPAAIVAGKDGNFYGFATSLIFKITPSGDFTLLHRFATDGSADAFGAPVEGADGTFYGVALYGGGTPSPSANAGFAFEFTSTGQFTLLHTFVSGGSDGANPFGGLVLGRDRNLYGTTSGGGLRGGGTIFQMTPAGVVTVLHSFRLQQGERAPKAALTVGPDGDLYGTASEEDAPSTGAFFRLAPGGSGPMEADDTQVPDLIGPGNGTGASVAGGILTYTDGQTHKVVKYKVQRPAFAAAITGIPTQGPWIWVADDGQHGSMLSIDASGNVTATMLPMQTIQTMLGPGR
jgi:uncharacterized repeat protein (TIGR03803 family)